MKDCIETPPLRQFSPIDRYCEGCGLEHLPKHCPVRATLDQTSGPKTGLNYIEVIPSPNLEEAEADYRSLKVVTRAQTHVNPTGSEHKQAQTEPLAKKKRCRKARSRRSKKAKLQEDSEPIEPTNEEIRSEEKRPKPMPS